MHYNIGNNALVFIDGVAFRHLGQTVPGVHQLMNAITGAAYIHTFDDGTKGLLTDAAFDVLLLAGRLKVVDNAPRTEGDLVDCDAEECTRLDPASAKMLAQCVVLDDNGVKNSLEATKAGLAKFWTGELLAKHGPADTAHSVKRWRAERGKPGNRHQWQMVRMWGRGNGAPFLGDVPNELLQRAALDHYSSKTTLKTTHANCATDFANVNAGLDPRYPKPKKAYRIPSASTVRRACIALESAATLAERDGKQIVDAEWRGAGRPLIASRALELGVIDHSPIPQYTVIDPERQIVVGQPWLTMNVDVHSRVILGHVITFRPPSVATVAEVIRRSNRPKRPPEIMQKRYPGLARICGKDSEYVVDNGPEFRGHGLEDMAKSAGFGIRFCPIKQPRYKAMGERAFGTVFTRLRDRLRGSTRHIAWLNKAGVDPSKDAVITIDQLEAAVNHILAEYHTEPHDGDIPPLLKFEKSVAVHGIDLIHDVDSHMKEINEVKPGVQLTKSGIRMFSGLRYHDVRLVPELLDDLVRLEPRRQRRDDATATVKVKYDPENIATIHVWNRHTKRYVTLRCDDETYADGMPLWLHEEIRASAKRECAEFNTEAERLAARSRRISAIRDISPDARMDERKAVARLSEIPRLRQITGNLVHLHSADPCPVTIEDFISHDLASVSSLDAEILAPRKPISSAEGRTNGRDRRDAGQPRETSPSRKTSRRSSRAVKGTYS